MEQLRVMSNAAQWQDAGRLRHQIAPTALALALYLCFRVLPAVAIGGLMLLLLAVRPAAASAGLSEVEAGQMLLSSGANTQRTALKQSSEVHFAISGMLAVVTLEQEFHNDSSDWAEGLYLFPLPDDAAVRAMEISLGERRIVGKIRERAEAKKIYRQAKREGKAASLVEQLRPNMFSNRVANIAPGERIRVRLEYVQKLRYVGGEFSLRFPMTITPRYIPGTAIAVAGESGDRAEHYHGQEQQDGQAGSPAVSPAVAIIDPLAGWALPTDAVPDAHLITPFLHPQRGSEAAPLNPIRITATVDMGVPLADVSSPFHEISLRREQLRYSVSLSKQVSEMDRDFVLQWRPQASAAPQAAMFQQTVAGEHYGLLMLLPPATSNAPPVQAREMVFVIDTSGSMGGVSIAQARESLAYGLSLLRPEDRFNIIEFNSDFRRLHRQSVPATAHYLQHAQEFVRHLGAGGGTEILPALKAALATPADDDSVAASERAKRLRQIVFITDGAVGNEAQILEQIAGNLSGSNVFTVGIGSAPNAWFMRKVAQLGGGTHTFIGNPGEVAEKMAALFAQLAAPAATKISLQWPVPVESWPTRIPDLYLGEPLLVAVKFTEAPGAGTLRISGSLGGEQWQRDVQLSANQASPQHPGVASLWAREKIAALMEQLYTGVAEETVREEVLPLALQHQLMSAYTSFVAVEDKPIRPLDQQLKSGAIANTQPKGQAAQPYAYAQTATSASAKTLLGSLLLFLAMMIHVLRREEVDRDETR